MSELLSKRLVLEFTKMTGAGNDFLVIDNRFYHFGSEELSVLAQKYCARKISVGADGLLALEESGRSDLDFKMVYYNADGSRGSMCGNGARCLSRFARLTGMNQNPLTFEADAGEYVAEVPDSEEGNVILHLPPFADFRQDCVISDTSQIDPSRISYIWTGTEHVVVGVNDIESFPVESVGRRLRHDKALSKIGANINFVQSIGNNSDRSRKLRVRTYERGVEAETMACGTGAIASAMVAALTADEETKRIEVVMNGGVLFIWFDGEANNPEKIFLEGPADVVYRGTLEVD